MTDQTFDGALASLSPFRLYWFITEHIGGALVPSQDGAYIDFSLPPRMAQDFVITLLRANKPALVEIAKLMPCGAGRAGSETT